MLPEKPVDVPQTGEDSRSGARGLRIERSRRLLPTFVNHQAALQRNHASK